MAYSETWWESWFQHTPAHRAAVREATLETLNQLADGASVADCVTIARLLHREAYLAEVERNPELREWLHARKPHSPFAKATERHG